jgi:hypothetical protein
MLLTGIDTCILCGGPLTGPPPEQVVSEALGSPPDAVLRNGEMCTRCIIAKYR